MTAYYNEIDPQAAQWLRNLIAAGHIAPGDVDARSIKEVSPDDLKGYTQCHFFAGIGVWSYALRRTGWPDDRPVWTGSCPCQPFSTAGSGKEFADERHLWPAWFGLILERGPGLVFGEQIASKVAESWIDHVSTDLEGAGYTFGAVDTCAAGFGAPHIRQRFFFVAQPDRERCEGLGLRRLERGSQQALPEADGSGAACVLADADRPGSPAERGNDGEMFGRQEGARGAEHGSALPGGRGAVNGFWSGAEWLACRDGKARPVEPGTVPLVDGAPARLVRLRAYGNAICAPVAEEFIRAYIDVNRIAQEEDRKCP